MLIKILKFGIKAYAIWCVIVWVGFFLIYIAPELAPMLSHVFNAFDVADISFWDIITNSVTDEQSGAFVDFLYQY